MYDVIDWSALPWSVLVATPLARFARDKYVIGMSLEGLVYVPTWIFPPSSAHGPLSNVNNVYSEYVAMINLMALNGWIVL